MENGVLKLKPDDRYLGTHDKVNQIEKLNSSLTYKMEILKISKADGLNLNEVDFQPLKKLSIFGIMNFKGDFQDLGIFRNLDKINTLEITHSKITKVVNTANDCIFPNLEDLTLSYNKLTTFDLGLIRCSQKLRSLDISGNEIETIQNSSPDGACMWPNLQYLTLIFNKLKHFEPLLFSCSKKLISLLIAENQLTTFLEKPATCYWPDLTTLELSGNQITFFNEEVFLCFQKL